MLDTPVLVVGAGPVGLGLAIDLARRGVSSLVIEARDGSINNPKMSQVSMRSMEICRRWGLAEDIEAVSWPHDYPQDAVYVTSMRGYEIGRTVMPPYAVTPEKAITPHGNCHCPQIFFDPILQRRARGEPLIELRYLHELRTFVDHGDGVEATIFDRLALREYVLRSRYVVGCDGANSTVRTVLGIDFTGEGRLSSSFSIYFRSSELATLHDMGWARFYRLVDQGGHWGDLVGIDGKELWRFTLLDLGNVPGDEIDVQATLFGMAGGPFAYETLATLAWDRRDQVAATYRSGSAFLCGDSAHVLSPTGGLGMNTGLADAYDLSWKLAATVHGWAGPHLVESYDAERRPIAHANVAASTTYFRRLRSVFPTGLHLAEDGATGERARQTFADAFREIKTKNLLYISEQLRLGFTYEHSPIVVPDGTVPPVTTGLTYIPNARPGARAPHLPLADGHSLLDCFGDGFVMLRVGAAAPACDGLERIANDLGIPLQSVALADPEALRIYEQPLVLVRPDGHVAWRGPALPSDLRGLLETVRGGRSQFPFR